MNARSPNLSRPSGWVIVCTLLAVLILASPALADTIYLKNGQVIHTERARIEGDWVIFLQFGSEVQIPLSIVDRVEQDERAGPEPTPAPELEALPEPGEEEGEPGEEGAEAEGEEAGEEPAPEETREYWQDRIRSILEERQELQERLRELRREERAFLFSHRSTAETRRQIEAVQERQRELEEEMQELHREARRRGIPPGWLRLDSSERPGDPG